MIDQIKYPYLTDKTLELIEYDKYTFDVDVGLTKTKIKEFIEKTFDVQVLRVNTHIPPRKKKRTGMKSKRKRVILTLQKGKQINMFS